MQSLCADCFSAILAKTDLDSFNNMLATSKTFECLLTNDDYKSALERFWPERCESLETIPRSWKNEYKASLKLWNDIRYEKKIRNWQESSGASSCAIMMSFADSVPFPVSIYIALLLNIEYVNQKFFFIKWLCGQFYPEEQRCIREQIHDCLKDIDPSLPFELCENFHYIIFKGLNSSIYDVYFDRGCVAFEKNPARSDIMWGLYEYAVFIEYRDFLPDKYQFLEKLKSAGDHSFIEKCRQVIRIQHKDFLDFFDRPNIRFTTSAVKCLSNHAKIDEDDVDKDWNDIRSCVMYHAPQYLDCLDSALATARYAMTSMQFEESY
jgi:hypothetical protein